MGAYDDLMAFQRETEALVQISGRLGWDQETVMPRGAGAQRSEEAAALESVLHGRRMDPRVGEWLAAAEAPDAVAAANLREIRRSYDRATKVPAALASAIARATSLGQPLWAEARAAEDFDAFAPTLKEIVALRREEGAALAEGGDVYDALLADYEPETSAAEIDAIFTDLRTGLVDLRDRILGSSVELPEFPGELQAQGQLALSREMALTFGYDLSRGRIDEAAHPFSSGSGNDVRITTRVTPGVPLESLYAAIHETGHAAYEQAVDPAFHLTPIGRGASMAVHESQSRICENQLGRSRAFAGFLWARLHAVFGEIGVPDAEMLYRILNRVHPGHIRVAADEVHYNLHIMMRFDLERALVTGDLEVDDLPGAWNDRFAADFGVAVDRPSNGVLQDVHWSVGLFGYFPTYALGNVYAGCLYEAMARAVPDLEAHLAEGHVVPATGWLTDRLRRFGALRTPRETIAFATGAAPSPGPLLGYLNAKFGALYGV